MQRRIAQEVSRAAERTRVAVSVDAHQARVWLRNPRGTIPCACSAGRGGSGLPGTNADVVLAPGEGDFLNSPDSGYPLAGPPPASGDDRPPLSADSPQAPPWLEDLATLFLGGGRRCGVCWGTGWVDGHRLWGGYRLLMCITDTTQVTLVDDSGVSVDSDSPCPTMVGPGTVTWSLDIPYGNKYVDALRVRDGLVPSSGGYVLEGRVASDEEGKWRPVEEVLGLADYRIVGSEGIIACDVEGLQIRMTLLQGARVSHVELVVRSEPLVNVQLPQLQQAANQELIAPQFAVDFELDPVVGAVERGSLLEIPGQGGMLGGLWIVTDVEPKKSAQGQIFGMTGQVRNAQPTDVVSAALLDDSNIGVVDPGYSTRGLEPQLGGEPSGPLGDTDESVAAAKRGSQPRVGGGTSGKKSPIILNRGDASEGWDD